MEAKKVFRRVRSIEPALFSPKRWFLMLDCGHLVTITAPKQPERQRAWCEVCSQSTAPLFEPARTEAARDPD